MYAVRLCYTAGNWENASCGTPDNGKDCNWEEGRARFCNNFLDKCGQNSAKLSLKMPRNKAEEPFDIDNVSCDTDKEDCERNGWCENKECRLCRLYSQTVSPDHLKKAGDRIKKLFEKSADAFHVRSFPKFI